MGNPWTDPEKARRWQPTGKPGQSHREHALAVVFALMGVHAPQRILDLGCGVGDIDVRLLTQFPGASLVGLDASAGMLERAAQVLAPFGDRATLLERDLKAAWQHDVAGGFDVVLASQTVHHLEAEAKRDLFGRVLDVLAPGGLFVLSDKVRFDGVFHAHHVVLWNRTRAEHGFDPVDPAQSRAEYLAEEREGGDVPDGIGEQLGWLRDAGFAGAESFWQHGDKAVFAALKAPA